MESSNTILSRINRLIDRLIRQNERLKKENSALLVERGKLVKDKERLNDIIENYRREERVRKLYTAFLSDDEDKQKAKRQIERILREINDCIDSLRSKE